jgi:hypothetical protein
MPASLSESFVVCSCQAHQCNGKVISAYDCKIHRLEDEAAARKAKESDLKTIPCTSEKRPKKPPKVRCICYFNNITPEEY